MYGWVTRGAGSTALVIMLFIGGFLLFRATDAIRAAGWHFLTTAQWQPEGGRFGIAAILTGTVLIGLTAITIALPLALGTALFISEYAPVRLRRLLVNLVDLMAAVPSVVYGLWGFFLLQPQLLVRGPQGDGLPRWLATHFGWIPVFRVEQGGQPVDPSDPATSGTVFTSSIFIAGVIVALMVAPIACSIMRESFSQAPLGEREGAYALGATKWGMIRSVVLPFGRGGIIGGTMLGLGRALGETIAVYMVLSIAFDVKIRILENGGSSVSSLIALRFGEASDFGTSALMAAGLALFVLTLIVNTIASAAISRSRSGATTG
ncbi:MAG: phosphate ABC transporter permease subunit PstC [Actinomycetota bacterium]|nr:phosphate ABC transporter permease subunit PstC [Actinomycetota bacterium]